jgi:replicative DNA helicase
MTDLELAQQALPVSFYVLGREGDGYSADRLLNESAYDQDQMLAMYLTGMAKAREIDAGICKSQKYIVLDPHRTYSAQDICAAQKRAVQYIESAIRSQGKK